MAKKKTVVRPIETTSDQAARKKKLVKKGALPGQKPKPNKKKSKKEHLDAFSPENLHKTSSAGLAAIAKRFATEYSDPFIAVAGEVGRIVCGIAVPFAYEYLIQNTVLPMGRMTSIVGKTHSNKSALSYEFFRWLRPYGGQGYLVENESKSSPDLANSIIGYEDEGDVTPWLTIPSYSVEDWQGKLQAITDGLRRQWTVKSDDNPFPPGSVFPAIITLDSIMGKLSEESQAKIEEVGHSGRAFAHEALIITSYLKKFPQDLAAWPIHFVAVNHLKMKPVQPGQHQPGRGKAGGVHIDFQQTFEIELAKLKKIDLVDISTEGFKVGGNVIKMRCYKNGLGEDQHIINVPIIWWNRRYERADGQREIRQYTKWDWDSAAIDLLTDFKQKTYLDKVREVVDIHQVTGPKFWSKALGVLKNDALPKSDLGRLLTRDRKIRNDLRDLFGIKRRKEFQKGVDYLEQIGILRAEAEEQMDSMDE